MNLERVFVYGTLKKGEIRNDILWDCDYLGPAATDPIFQMVTLGQFPGLIPGHRSIEGEVYEVPADVLGYLDLIEGHPHFFRRSQHEVWLDDDLSMDAWIYLLVDPELAIMPINQWPHEKENL